ncbi:MAG: phosphoribosyl-AMP cyclohydrolase [Devosiaceae bacterium]|nr:phosphoribosyl-AMP cyclohydrolase [Devosiaceae bacterium]
MTANKFSDPKILSAKQLESGDIFAPKFNNAGLIMVIASDVSNNEILMVAHMNEEALKLTLQSGIVHYYSRSRSALWKKGETSGEIQKLIEMRTDCDQDVLLLKVEQVGRGAACHTGRKSCFYRRVVDENGSILLKTDNEPRIFDPAEVYKK